MRLGIVRGWRIEVAGPGGWRAPWYRHAFAFGPRRTLTGYRTFRLPFVLFWKPVPGIWTYPGPETREASK